MDKEIGEKIVARLMALSEEANKLTGITIDMGQVEEARELRRSLANILVEIDEMLRQVVRQHPDLNPDKE